MSLNKISINDTTTVNTGIVYDISKATGQSYDTLSDALSGNNVPLEIREGGMTVRFVSNSDNKYVQYRLMATSFSATESDWQGVDDVPTAGSDNLVKSGGVFEDTYILNGYETIDCVNPMPTQGVPSLTQSTINGKFVSEGFGKVDGCIFKAAEGTLNIYKSKINDAQSHLIETPSLIISIVNTHSEAGKYKKVDLSSYNINLQEKELLIVNGSYYWGMLIPINSSRAYTSSDWSTAPIAFDQSGYDAISFSVYRNVKKEVEKLGKDVKKLTSIPKVIVDASGNGDFTSVQEAIYSSASTIIVYPGIYTMDEYTDWTYSNNQNISIIGTDKDKCILINTNGRYTTAPTYVDNAPLKMSGNCLLKNLTIIASHEDFVGQDISNCNAYCIHIDMSARQGDVFEIDNCRLINKQAPCLGIGLRNGFTLKVHDSELVTTQINPSNNDTGTILIHDDSNMDENINADFILYNNTIVNTNGGRCIFAMTAYNKPFKASFINNTLKYRSDGGASGVFIHYPTVILDRISAGNKYLPFESYQEYRMNYIFGFGEDNNKPDFTNTPLGFIFSSASNSYKLSSKGMPAIGLFTITSLPSSVGDITFRVGGTTQIIYIDNSALNKDANQLSLWISEILSRYNIYSTNSNNSFTLSALKNGVVQDEDVTFEDTGNTGIVIQSSLSFAGNDSIWQSMDLSTDINLLKDKKTFISTDFTSQVDPITGESNSFYRSIFKQSTDTILTIKGSLWASYPGQIVFCAFDANGTVINNSKIFSTLSNSYVNIDIDVADDWKYYSIGWIADQVPSQNDSNAVVYSNKYVDMAFLPSIRLPFSIKNKYLGEGGTLIDNSDCNSTPKISISGYDRLYLSNVYIGALAYGIFFDVNDNIVSRFQNDGAKQTLSIPNGAASVQLTNFTSLVANPIVCLANTSFFEQPFNKKTQRDDEIVYKSVVRKPFVFSKKTAVFTGDSITYGFTDPEHVVYGTGDYPTLFSNAVGMTYSNISVGGAAITENVIGAAEPSITQQVKNASKNIDYLFIAGGTNDWQAGVPYSTFKQAIDSLCDYINENYASSVQVIWITPINNGGRPYSSPELDLQIYRNIMTTEILGHDTYNRFSIIQGNEFPFPSEYDNTPDGVAIMFGDQLHPSAIGYQWYAAFLKTLLL